MPFICKTPDAQVRINYLFNRLEASRDNRRSWEVLPFAGDCGTLRAVTFFRECLLLCSDKGLFALHEDGVRALHTPKGHPFVDAVSHGKCLYATDNTEVFASRDGGKWTPVFHARSCGTVYGLLSTGEELLAACAKGVYRAMEGAKNWQPLYVSRIGGFFCLDALDATLYACTGSGYYQSTDGGRTWTPLKNTAGPWSDATGTAMKGV